MIVLITINFNGLRKMGLRTIFSKLEIENNVVVKVSVKQTTLLAICLLIPVNDALKALVPKGMKGIFHFRVKYFFYHHRWHKMILGKTIS